MHSTSCFHFGPTTLFHEEGKAGTCIVLDSVTSCSGFVSLHCREGGRGGLVVDFVCSAGQVGRAGSLSPLRSSLGDQREPKQLSCSCKTKAIRLKTLKRFIELREIFAAMCKFSLSYYDVFTSLIGIFKKTIDWFCL